MCKSPLYRVGQSFLEFEAGRQLPVFRKVSQQGQAIIGWRDYLDLKNRYRIPDEVFTQIPCGKCIECRIKKAQEWTIRCQAEQMVSRNALFVTLTYNDENLTFTTFKNYRVPVLVKKDFQDFMKRLRKSLFGNKGGDLRYFACGEYGDRTFRPHFHAIFFNIDLPDMELFAVKKRIPYYVSNFLAERWSHGHVLISACNRQTTAYTAQYNLKKVGFLGDTKSNAAFMDAYDEPVLSSEAYRRLIYSGYVQMPFILASRRPAIGRKWVDENFEEVPKALPSFKLNKVKYFDDRLKVIDAILLDEAKEARASVAEAARRNTERRLIMPEGVRFWMQEQDSYKDATRSRDESGLCRERLLTKGKR